MILSARSPLATNDSPPARSAGPTKTPRPWQSGMVGRPLATRIITWLMAVRRESSCMCLLPQAMSWRISPSVDQLRRTIFRYRFHPQRVVADTAYGTAENLLALESDGIRAFMPLPDWEKSSAYYRSSAFTYDVERDIYVCPQDQTLSLGGPTSRESGSNTELSSPSATLVRYVTVVLRISGAGHLSVVPC